MKDGCDINPIPAMTPKSAIGLVLLLLVGGCDLPKPPPKPPQKYYVCVNTETGETFRYWQQEVENTPAGLAFKDEAGWTRIYTDKLKCRELPRPTAAKAKPPAT